MTSSNLNQIVPGQASVTAPARTAQTFPLSRSARFRAPGWLIARRSILHLVLIALALTMLFPFFWTVSAALKGDEAVLATPPQLLPIPAHWENFAAVMQTIPFWQLLFNTLLVAAVSTPLPLFICSFAPLAFFPLLFPRPAPLFPCVPRH